MMTAPMLYAISQGKKCVGDQECHWCSAPCERSKYLHDGPPNIPFVKNGGGAKRPGNAYICVGCWLFRRPRITVRFLDGWFKDGQCPLNHSWWITDEDALAVRPTADIYKLLLDPPKRFVLSLIEGNRATNNLQLATVNDLGISGHFIFTINNVAYRYTVGELGEVLLKGKEVEGKEPGVRALLRLVGEVPEFAPPKTPSDPVKPTEKRSRGRPAKQEAHVDNRHLSQGQ